MIVIYLLIGIVVGWILCSVKMHEYVNEMERKMGEMERENYRLNRLV